MFILCIESSHQRGMGHLFRALNFFRFFRGMGRSCLLLINDHAPSHRLLDEQGVSFETVDLQDLSGDWESVIIRKYRVSLWINDRLTTAYEHAARVKRHNIPLVTFDDRGSGAELSDQNFAALAFAEVEHFLGNRVFTGVEYLVLNREIEGFRRYRQNLERVVVTLGGSDTYGVTLQVLELLRQIGISATIHVGPAFCHHRELVAAATAHYPVIGCLPSLIAELDNFDLAITGCGITPFEANAMGLPCLLVASENHELATGNYLAASGSSVFLGHRQELSLAKLRQALTGLKIERMSRRGIEMIPLTGVENIWRELQELVDG